MVNYIPQFLNALKTTELLRQKKHFLVKLLMGMSDYNFSKTLSYFKSFQL